MKKSFFLFALCALLFSAAMADIVFAFELPEYEVLVGKQVRPKAVTQGVDGKITYTWTSSDTAIATVANGVVTGKGAGQAVITCTANASDGSTYEASCTVSVIKPISSIKVEKQKVILAALDHAWSDRDPEYGEEPFYYQTIVTILPEDATNKTLKWSSSDQFVALVEDDGMVQGWAKSGTTIIKVEATDGSGRYATFKVTVPEVYTTKDKIVIDSEDGVEWGYQMNGSFSIMSTKDNGVFTYEKIENYGGIEKIRLIPKKEGSGTIIVKSGKTQKNIPVTVKSSAVRSDKTYPPHKVSKILQDKDKYIGAKVGISNASGADIQLVSRGNLETYKDDQEWDNAYNSYCGYTIMRVQENDLMYFAVEQRYPQNLLEKENVKIYGKIVGYTTYVSATGLEYECPVLAFATVVSLK